MCVCVCVCVYVCVVVVVVEVVVVIMGERGCGGKGIVFSLYAATRPTTLSLTLLTICLVFSSSY